jgi:hypothetical protein
MPLPPQRPRARESPAGFSGALRGALGRGMQRRLISANLHETACVPSRSVDAAGCFELPGKQRAGAKALMRDGCVDDYWT